jgi:nicotinate-nucleotide pyrophosphorylase (carboxylating)
MFEYHPLSEATRRRLITGGVDPDAVAAIVRMAIAEDLAGGIDVTSTATVPTTQRSSAAYRARGAGTVAGLALAAAGRLFSPRERARNACAGRMQCR